MPTYSGIYTPSQVMQQAGSGLYPGVTLPGQQVYTGGYGSTASGSSTLYTWVAPPGITSVCVVCVGSGGGGNSMVYQTTATSAGGGGLGYKNNIAVTPGVGYTVAAGDYTNVGPSPSVPTINGGESYFINASTVRGGPGIGAPSGTGGTFTGDGGGNGGNGGTGYNGYPSLGYSVTGGAGGAGGYSGNGGNGGSSGAVGSGGTGGAGGGGGGGPYEYGAPYYPWGGGGGGGVGLLGIGASGGGGSAGVASSTGGGGGGGGSGGSAGGSNTASTAAGGGGGQYGGGGATGFYNGPNSFGAVRIIWQGPTPGTPRTFPNNAGNV